MQRDEVNGPLSGTLGRVAYAFGDAGPDPAGSAADLPTGARLTSLLFHFFLIGGGISFLARLSPSRNGEG